MDLHRGVQYLFKDPHQIVQYFIMNPHEIVSACIGFWILTKLFSTC